MLTAIERGKDRLYAKPRMDMPDGKALSYPTKHVGPYAAFAGP